MRPEASALQKCWVLGSLLACAPSDLRPVGEDPRPSGSPAPVDTADVPLPPLPGITPVINELLAYNRTGLRDDAGLPVDWIELYDPGDEPIELRGFSLTNAFGDPAISPLDPSLSIGSREFLLLFADGHPELGPTHLAITLDIEGDLGLFYDYGPVQLLTYDSQAADVSAARVPDGASTWVNDESPTPGESNSASAD
jgi:hypothetical protein